MSRRKQVAALLDRYQPADDTEAQHQRRMRQLCDVGGDPFSRDHYAPGHFTASCFVLHPTEQSVLLIHHSKLHRWLQPGGHVDPDDVDVEAAARREAMEEVNLSDLILLSEGLFDLDVHEIPSLGGKPIHEHFDLRFLFRARTHRVQAGSDANGARWIGVDEVKAEMSDESVLRALRKLA
jgi:8-oxo-dGTP pyrophosphatase MutT (NUDIX family)